MTGVDPIDGQDVVADTVEGSVVASLEHRAARERLLAEFMALPEKPAPPDGTFV